MVEHLVIIKVWLLEINLLALTVFSDLDRMLMGFIPHCFEQKYVLIVNMGKYSKNFKIKRKINLS